MSSYGRDKCGKEAGSVQRSAGSVQAQQLSGRILAEAVLAAVLPAVIAKQTEGSVAEWFCTAYCNLTLKLCPALPCVIIDG